MILSHLSIGGGVTGIETLISIVQTIKRKLERTKKSKKNKILLGIIDKNSENIPGGVAYGFKNSQYGYFNNPIRLSPKLFSNWILQEKNKFKLQNYLKRYGGYTGEMWLKKNYDFFNNKEKEKLEEIYIPRVLLNFWMEEKLLKLFEEVAFNYANGTDDGTQAGNTIELNGTHDRTDIEAVGVANMLQAIYENDANIDDFVMVLTPQTYASLFKLSDFARYDGIGNSQGSVVPFISGFAGKLGGVEVIVSNNFMHYGAGSSTLAASSTPVGNFSANGVSDESEKLLGFLIHKDAMHLAYSNGMKARVQSDYHLPSLSTRFVADSVYGCLITGSTTSGNKKVFALVSPAS